MGSSGGGATQSTSGGGWTSPVLYGYKDILPPWAQQAQATAVPWLTSRAFAGGMTPLAKKDLWGEIRNKVNAGTDSSLKQLTSKAVQAGWGAKSPALVGAMGNVASQRSSNLSNAALEFAKLKTGAQDSAIQQMLSAAYAPTPYAVGQKGSNWSLGSGSSGGGK